MNRLSRVRRAVRGLSWPERRVLATTWLLLPCVAIGLRLLGFARSQAVLLTATDAPESRTDLREAESLARLVDAAACWNPVPATCLVRSMVLCRLLRRRGLAADLRIGVDNPDGGLSAHAWVEHGGVALAAAGRRRHDYTAFDDSVIPGGI